MYILHRQWMWYNSWRLKQWGLLSTVSILQLLWWMCLATTASRQWLVLRRCVQDFEPVRQCCPASHWHKRQRCQCSCLLGTHYPIMSTTSCVSNARGRLILLYNRIDGCNAKILHKLGCDMQCPQWFERSSPRNWGHWVAWRSHIAHKLWLRRQCRCPALQR